jgi:tRNA-dihydrouridine synthase B
MRIGPSSLPNALFVAPMAGVTDRPFRMLCRSLGAGHAVSEMVTSKRELWHSLKTSRRADHDGRARPDRGADRRRRPAEMADAARYNIDRGAQIIDINMGCPAKKVCNKWAGSALMQDEPLALRIVEAVVAACAPLGVPVTLKMRTGWCASERNALSLARARRSAGVAMVTVHGRTREQGYGAGRIRHRGRREGRAAHPGGGQRRHRFPAKARARAGAHRRRCADDRPRRAGPAVDLPRDRALPGHRQPKLPPPATREVQRWLTEHLHDHYALYGERTGVRSARKHIGWAVRGCPAARPSAPR